MMLTSARCEQVLYNVDLLARYGSATYMSAVWNSATYGSNPVSPTSLVMQQVRMRSAGLHRTCHVSGM